MAQLGRPGLSIAQKAAVWKYWQAGQSFSDIGRLLGKAPGSIYRIVASHGGITPPRRRRSRWALTVAEREEISRGLAANSSLRHIAAVLGRAPSTVMREVARHGGRVLAGGPYGGHGLNVFRTGVTKGGMPPLAIIKNFNEVKQISFCLVSGLILAPMYPLPFQRGKETFRHRVVVTIPYATHATGIPVGFQQILKLLTGILTAAIAVMNEAR